MGVEIISKYFKNISKDQIGKFASLERLYSEWNEKINVISRSDIQNLYTNHVLHSLAVAKFFELNIFNQEKKSTLCSLSSNNTIRILDVGTGGGFPGVPLAIFFPNFQFVLVDSIGKKIKVVENISKSLGLTNIISVHSRVEELDIASLTVGNRFDWIVSRAVTSLPNFIPWIRGKYKDGAIFLKGGELKEEISQCCKNEKISPDNFITFEISDWFDEPFFNEKKLLYLTSR